MRKNLARLLVFILGFQICAASLSSASTDAWIELRSSHFLVVTDAGEKQARHLADQFERMRWVFQTLFPKATVDPSAPIIVIAPKDKKGFQSLEPEAYLAKGQLDLAGYFLRGPDKNYILVRFDAEQEHPFATVYHEYTHVQLSKAGEWMPLWLNEGLAEFFQNTEFRDKDVSLGRLTAEDILYLSQQRLLPLPMLFKVDAISPYYHEEQKGSVFYAESWALTHYLEVTDNQAHTHRLAEYAELMSKHEDSVVAAEKAFGDLKDLQKTLESYIARGSFSYFRLPSSTTIDPLTFKVRALTPAQANAVRADLLAYNQRTSDARALLDSVMRDDPENTAAYETMGYIEFRQGDLDRAQKWYEQAVRLNSQSYLAHYYYAAISIRAGKTEDAQVEASLRTAIKLNPAFAPAYDQLATYYGMKREKLDQAHLLNLQAVDRDPANVTYRMNAANILMELDRYPEAIDVLRIAAKVARTPAEAESVGSFLRQVQDFQSMRDQATKTNRPQSKNVQMTTTNNAIASAAPKHSAEEARGPRHTAKGVLRAVQCSYPSSLELKVQGPDSGVNLHSSNQIAFMTLDDTHHAETYPSTDLEGMRARVEYSESTDKTADGRIALIEISK